MMAGSLPRTFTILLAMVVAPRDDPPPKPEQLDPIVEAELKRLAGVWILESVEVAGKKLDREKPGAQELEIVGDAFKLTRKDGARSQFTIKVLRPAANPAEIDLALNLGRSLRKAVPGIYKLEGDTLTVCTDKDARPKTFVSAANRQNSLFVYKRQKPKKTDT